MSDLSIPLFFMVFASLAGLTFSSIFVSSITNTMMMIGSLREAQNRQLRIVREYVQAHGITTRLGLRAKQHVEHDLSGFLRCQHETQLLALLPSHLLMDLHNEA